MHQIDQQLFTEGITTDFLISQNEQQIEEIAKELTSSTIQQNKFKYAVSQIKRAKIKIDQISFNEQNQSFPQETHNENIATTTVHNPQLNHCYEFKLVMLGDTAVGKSSVVLRFVKNEFFEYQESTIGAAFLTQTVAINDYKIKFEIWDTAGQERYHSLAPMY